MCLSFAGLSGVAVAASGCGGSEPSGKPLTETYDEYTEALTNAVIASPTGTVVIGADGGVVPTDAGMGGSSSGGGTGSSSGVLGSSSGAFDAGPPPPSDGGPTEAGAGGGFGFWHFDDCSPTSPFLLDSSGMGANAQHALGGACVAGISGLGVQFRTAKDIVTVPDEPQFTVSSRVAVAAWVHPDSVTGDEPIVLKRLNTKTSFSLGVHKSNIEMSVVLSDGKTIISQAPIAAGVWTHVAGMFDGTFLYLFVNGQEFGKVYAAGSLRDVIAPVRIGATTQSQHFDGIIDEVFVSTEAIATTDLTALACIHRPTTVVVSPPVGGPVPFDTPVHYGIAVSDNDVGACQPASYEVFSGSTDPGISVTFDTSQFPSAQPGTTVVVGADVSGSSDADPGTHVVPIEVLNFGQNFEFIPTELTFVLAQPTGCLVTTRRELMILDTSVVDDPVRAPGAPVSVPEGGLSDDGGSVGFDASLSPPPPPAALTATDAAASDASAPPASAGVWTFGRLMRDMAPTPAAASAMTENLLDNWLTNQTINGFTVAARPAMQQVVLGIWPRLPDGSLDLDQAPLRLQAIVDRVDLRNLAAGSAGEGRFVFAFNDAFGNPQQFTVILEFNLPAQTQADVAQWANLWHGLSTHPFPSEEYNAALEAITSRFASRGASPGSVNGSALLALRTNEIVLSGGNRWELREFTLSPQTGFFQEVTVKETPDLGFNGSSTFADFVNQNAAAIVAEVPGATGVVPAQFEGAPFLGGSVFNDFIEWSAPGIASEDARFHASLNTCNGCHGPETNTGFLMVTPRQPGSPAVLSPFLTGTTSFGPTGVAHTLNDLARRRTDLTNLVCGTDGGTPPPPPPTDGGPIGFDAGVTSPEASGPIP